MVETKHSDIMLSGPVCTHPRAKPVVLWLSLCWACLGKSACPKGSLRTCSGVKGRPRPSGWLGPVKTAEGRISPQISTTVTESRTAAQEGIKRSRKTGNAWAARKGMSCIRDAQRLVHKANIDGTHWRIGPSSKLDPLWGSSSTNSRVSINKAALRSRPRP